MKVLLLGGTGLLSKEIMLVSLKKGHDVFILNRGRRLAGIPEQVKVLIADIRNRKQVSAVVENFNFDVIIDFLSYTPENLESVLELFSGKYQQYIFISTACVYRRDNKEEIITEQSTLINPDWNYSLNKANCEFRLKEICRKQDLFYTIVRPYITYDDTRIPYGIMPEYGLHWTLIARILNEKPVFIWDEGAAICTLTHVSDFAKGIVGLLGNPAAYNEAFHIVGDERYTWKEVITLIGKSVGKDVNLVEIPSVKIADILPEYRGILLGDRSLNAIFDNSKIKNVVPEFNTSVTLKEGLNRTIEYYRHTHFLKGIDYVWDAKIDKLIINSTSLSFKSLRYMDYLNENHYKNHIQYRLGRLLSERYVKYLMRLIP